MAGLVTLTLAALASDGGAPECEACSTADADEWVRCDFCSELRCLECCDEWRQCLECGQQMCEECRADRACVCLPCHGERGALCSEHESTRARVFCPCGEFYCGGDAACQRRYARCASCQNYVCRIGCATDCDRCGADQVYHEWCVWQRGEQRLCAQHDTGEHSSDENDEPEADNVLP